METMTTVVIRLNFNYSFIYETKEKNFQRFFVEIEKQGGIS
jgi:hypothetical protein